VQAFFRHRSPSGGHFREFAVSLPEKNDFQGVALLLKAIQESTGPVCD
jgi:hypothetical protein